MAACAALGGRTDQLGIFRSGSVSNPADQAPLLDRRVAAGRLKMK